MAKSFDEISQQFENYIPSGMNLVRGKFPSIQTESRQEKYDAHVQLWLFLNQQLNSLKEDPGFQLQQAIALSASEASLLTIGHDEIKKNDHLPHGLYLSGPHYMGYIPFDKLIGLNSKKDTTVEDDELVKDDKTDKDYNSGKRMSNDL